MFSHCCIDGAFFLVTQYNLSNYCAKFQLDGNFVQVSQVNSTGLYDYMATLSTPPHELNIYFKEVVYLKRFQDKSEKKWALENVVNHNLLQITTNEIFFRSIVVIQQSLKQSL